MGQGAPAARDLTSLFDPRSVAIVGASDDPGKYGHRLARRALVGHRPTYLVNPTRQTVLGNRTVPRLEHLGEPVDLAVIAVPAAAFDAAVGDALRAGVRAIVAITSGLGELGGDHLSRQRRLVEQVRAAGAVLLGPNCFGLVDHSTGLDACANDLPRGAVALISQSGNVALDIAAQLDAYGLGFSRFVSVGNQADLDLVELLDSCVEHEQTSTIALYCEGFTDGRRFARAASRAADAGKPVVLLTVGSGAASARGAASHTGSLVTPRTVVEAACAAVGAELVATPAELANLVQGLTRVRPPRGRRVAVIADGGGHGSMAGEAAEARGLLVEPFSPTTRASVAALLPPRAGTSNPVDLAGAADADLGCFSRLTEVVLETPEVDSVLLTGYFGGYAAYGARIGAEELRVASEISSLVKRTGGSFVAHLMFDRSPAAAALRDAGVAVYRDVEAATWVLQRLADRSLRTPGGVPDAPAPGETVIETGYWAARRRLAAAGIPFPAGAEVSTVRDLTWAAASLTYPLVLKALASGHKSDDGGVALDLRTEAELLRAWDDLHDRLAPPACSVEEMADLGGAVELIVGARQDPAFGVVVMVGLGGTHAELRPDISCALGPVTPASALALLRSLRGAALLDGYRGRPAVDVEAAALLVSRLSRFGAEHPELGEVECNPVAVSPGGALALDARMIGSTQHPAERACS